ncbi:MAG TPA: hypothetical protein H9887_03315 [Candidatus Dorea intestinavium]|nr:hypothetical protein [Candidatus Dorea intestinavium]
MKKGFIKKEAILVLLFLVTIVLVGCNKKSLVFNKDKLPYLYDENNLSISVLGGTFAKGEDCNIKLKVENKLNSPISLKLSDTYFDDKALKSLNGEHKLNANSTYDAYFTFVGSEIDSIKVGDFDKLTGVFVIKKDIPNEKDITIPVTFYRDFFSNDDFNN